MHHTPSYWRPVNPGAFVTSRAGETRIGESIAAPQQWSALLESLNDTAIVLVGVPESIGPRANLGRGGAEAGFAAFLQQFLNMQDAGRLPLDRLVLGGEVDCQDLMSAAAPLDGTTPKDLTALRDLCQQLDTRVRDVLTPLFASGARVILIGGGHNNALPLIQALADASNSPVGAVNLDPHSDFRPLEGRHSGNGFSYAHQQGKLQHYQVVSLHEAKNSRATLDQLSAAGASYVSMHQLQQSRMDKVMAEVARQACDWQLPFGIELDVDAITGAPASAFNYTGVSFAQAQTFVQRLAAYSTARYLHLAEAAPACHPAGLEAGNKACGQLLSELVFTYLLATNQ
ncbi:formimidoylglutamase [Aliidiomarina indica]|uniref:formimidoylglutamase n=1 Tax=Aliidiomarina indica TaxID=2749147 RepID=UPI0018907ED3|nr:formimidoylglutamase [Aliidiomarina indica]